MFTLATASLHRYGLNRNFEIAKELGFEAVEVFANNTYDTQDAEYLEKLVGLYNLPIVGLRVPGDANTPTQVKKIITIAENINIPTVIIRVPYFTDFKFASWFKHHLPKLQDATSVKIAVENVPAGSGFILPKYSIGTLAELKNFQYICLDTSHLVTRKMDLMRAYESVKKHLGFIHLSNWHKNNEHWMLSEGILPLESFLTKIAKDGFEGPISLKLNLDMIGSDNLKTVLKNISKCKEYYDKYYTANFSAVTESEENKM